MNTKLEGHTLETNNSRTLRLITMYLVILFLKTRERVKFGCEIMFAPNVQKGSRYLVYRFVFFVLVLFFFTDCLSILK